MQNPPAYVQVDAAGRSTRPTFQYSPYTGFSPSRDSNEVSSVNNLGHACISDLGAAARLQHLHNRITSSFGGGKNIANNIPLNGVVQSVPNVSGMPNFSQSRSYDICSPHPASFNEAFVNPFGLVGSGPFLNPYFGDRTRTPSPLHRLLQSQLLGGHPMNPASHQAHHYSEEHHFGNADDLLLDSVPSFRGLNLSTNYPSEERHHGHHSDPLVVSGHLSRSLDDLSVDVLENSSDSGKNVASFFTKLQLDKIPEHTKRASVLSTRTQLKCGSF